MSETATLFSIAAFLLSPFFAWIITNFLSVREQLILVAVGTGIVAAVWATCNVAAFLG